MMTQSSRWVCRACARVYACDLAEKCVGYTQRPLGDDDFMHFSTIIFYSFSERWFGQFLYVTKINAIALYYENTEEKPYEISNSASFFEIDSSTLPAACCHIFVFSYVLYVCVRSINDFNEPTIWCSWNICCLLHERRTAARGGMHTMKTNLCITNKRTHRRYIY